MSAELGQQGETRRPPGRSTRLPGRPMHLLGVAGHPGEQRKKGGGYWAIVGNGGGQGRERRGRALCQRVSEMLVHPFIFLRLT